MIAADEDALVCDFAETYGIFDYRALPVNLLATLAVGLRDDSRIKMRISGIRVPQNTLLLAAAVDRLAFLAWAKTEDAQKGSNCPGSILAAILGETEGKSTVLTYEAAEDFEIAWQEITGVKHGY